MILIKDFCSGQSVGRCVAAAADLYDVIASRGVISNVTPGKGGLVWQWGSEIAQTLSRVAHNVVDTISLNGAQGPESYFTVINSSVSAVEAWMIELPDGTNCSAQVGTLSLGAPGKGTQRFLNVPKYGILNGQTIPGYGNVSRDFPSNAFGFHYGSVPLSQTGSLVFGGYDQSRVLRDAAADDWLIA